MSGRRAKLLRRDLGALGIPPSERRRAARMGFRRYLETPRAQLFMRSAKRARQSRDHSRRFGFRSKTVALLSALLLISIGCRAPPKITEPVNGKPDVPIEKSEKSKEIERDVARTLVSSCDCPEGEICLCALEPPEPLELYIMPYEGPPLTFERRERSNPYAPPESDPRKVALAARREDEIDFGDPGEKAPDPDDGEKVRTEVRPGRFLLTHERDQARQTPSR